MFWFNEIDLYKYFLPIRYFYRNYLMWYGSSLYKKVIGAKITIFITHMKRNWGQKRLNELPGKLYPEFKPKSSNLKSEDLPFIPNLVEPSYIYSTITDSKTTHYRNYKDTNISLLLILISWEAFISQMSSSSPSLSPGP